ncbi:MAG: glycosyltransferase family 4 protein [bacterium]|nr:glycosyltransferase family 4 protein [bacterium]
MRILLVNKFFYPKGGSEKVFFETAELMKKNGHTVRFFSMVAPENQPSSESEYFVSNINFKQSGGIFQQFKTAGRILYSLEAKKKIQMLIDKEKPDLAHLHNIYHQISPSIIDSLKKNNIPIIMTLHDYKLTCPIYVLYRDQQVCDDCKNGKYYKVVLHRCVKNSRIKSILTMVEMYLHHSILHIYEQVDVFISPSRFLLNKTHEMGFKGRIVYLPNFIDAAEYTPEYQPKDNTLVYFGRLSEEKGVLTLLDAVKELDCTLKIIGEGPQQERLEQKVEQEQIKNVVFLGYKRGRELQDEIRHALAVVIPSEWYENNPRTIIESFALGKPVIGANIGGIPELVVDGQTGYLFQPGNSQDLRQQLIRAVTNKNKLVEMGKQARQLVETELTPEKHYQQLMEVYHEVLHRKGD